MHNLSGTDAVNKASVSEHLLKLANHPAKQANKILIDRIMY